MRSDNLENGRGERAGKLVVVRFRTFLSEVVSELKKTTWPSRKEVYGTTVVVIVAVFITALYLFIVDKTLERGMTFILSAFGR